MPVVIVRAALGQTWCDREHRLGPFQGLDLRLLIDTEHDRVLRRVEIQSDHIGNLRFQLRVGSAR